MSRRALILALACMLGAVHVGAARADDDGDGEDHDEGDDGEGGDNDDDDGSGGGRLTQFIPDLSAPVTLAIRTRFRARVRQQARIEVPATVVFNVTDVAQSTAQEGTSLLRASSIVLRPQHRLRIQIAAATNNFADQTGQASYPASKVSWVHGAVSGGTGRNDQLGGANVYRTIMTCNAGGPCTSAALKFTLSADPTQSASGMHTLVGHYRVSSVL